MFLWPAGHGGTGLHHNGLSGISYHLTCSRGTEPEVERIVDALPHQSLQPALLIGDVGCQRHGEALLRKDQEERGVAGPATAVGDESFAPIGRDADTRTVHVRAYVRPL